MTNQSGCHNDVKNVKKYLTEVQGFSESEMLILMDDGRSHPPTKRNIEDSFSRMCQYSQAGDVVFVHYSGHGGRVVDTSGDEEDGYDSTLIPVDFKNAGQIVDDDSTYRTKHMLRYFWGVECSDPLAIFSCKTITHSFPRFFRSLENSGQAYAQRCDCDGPHGLLPFGYCIGLAVPILSGRHDHATRP